MRIRLAIVMAAMIPAACGSSGSTLINDLTVDHGAEAAAEVAPLDETDAEGVDAADAVDLPDRGGEEIAPTCQPGEGCFGDECADGKDCQSGWCMEHMGGGVCSMECAEECPAGYSCKLIAGSPDPTYVCLSDFANLCRPCSSGSDCDSIGGIEDVCVSYGETGSFCGGSCAEGQACPWGFSCKTVQTVDGITTVQCIADAGECPCTDKSVGLALWTPCSRSSEQGKCGGKRLCTEDGLADCDAAVPAPETCNGTDDDCDGLTDEAMDRMGNPVGLCDDGNECTQDSCVGEAGCDHAALDGVECKDGDICTVADACKNGVCVGSPVTCEDSNPCTDDVCGDAGGCEFIPNTAGCDDDDPCTLGDTCQQGKCVGEAVSCDCGSNADCAALEDGDLCNGTLVCDKAHVPFQCKVDPDTVVTCPGPKGPDAPCLKPACVAATGECTFAPDHDGFPCENENLCSVGDKCAEGKCLDGPEIGCGDGNVCTDDACLPDTGCVHEANTLTCNDGNVCTTADLCIQTKCVGGPALECNDGNACTNDACDQAVGCTHLANALPCDDANACTSGDTCANGKCGFTGTVDCDDANPCTQDQCDALLGCFHNPVTGGCSDGDPCTLNDSCKGGKCVPGPAVSCDDANPCTDDSCTATGLCKHAANAAACNDQNACTTGDACVSGTCKSTGLLACDDGNPCTDDACDPSKGCVHTVNQAGCDDGDPCSVGDKCNKGICAPGPVQPCDDGNPCTADACGVDGLCVHTPAAAACDDGNPCTTVDACQAGKCKGSKPLDCNDKDVCTDDACDPDVGCVHSVNEAPCDDGSLCTTGDHCHLGECISAGPLDCDDDNPCTNDACSPQAGCTHAPNAAACDDFNACTTGDKCDGGKCKATGTVPCSDDNVCTNDSCSPLTGCSHAPNQAACDDGDPCTLNDKCNQSACLPGGPDDCNDNNLCTDDSCVPGAGCLHAANAKGCDDANLCTVGDKCGGGKCVPGPLATCNDSNACTNDSCLPQTGCVYIPFAPCCGNNVLEAGEECDDGNLLTGDGCDALCKVEVAVDVTFTTCGQSGPTGPSQGQCDAAYAGQAGLAGKVTVNAGIQQWTVPSSGTYRIETWGAQGGGSGGPGARMRGDFALTKGQVLKILVGQMGTKAPAEVGSGGGGGSFVVNAANNTALIIAGGGAGTGHNNAYSGSSNLNGRVSQDGAAGMLDKAGAGGTACNGGKESYTTGNGTPNGAGGGGFCTDGGSAGSAHGGKSFLNGGAGGNSTGGFGGGGGSDLFIYGCGSSPHGGSGGGGYSGGGAGGDNCNGGGGGAGSYNTGSNPSNSEGANSTHGKVRILRL